LVWLEQWLTQRFAGILLVVSHDQVFLDTVCTDILELKSTLAGASKLCFIFAGSCAWHSCGMPSITMLMDHRFNFLTSRSLFTRINSITGSSKSTLVHYSGDYATYLNTLAEQKVAQQRLRVAFEKERDKLREFIARDGKKYDNPAHQSQVHPFRFCV